MILDAGPFIAVERGDSATIAITREATWRNEPLRTSHAVLGQVWRGGAEQANIARLLPSLSLHALDDGRAIGRLLAITGTSDVVDAHLALLAAQTGEHIISADHDDLRPLLAAAGVDPAALRPWPPQR